MAVTASYNWVPYTAGTIANNTVTAGAQNGPAIARMDSGGYFATWNNASPATDIEARAYGPTGSPLSDEFRADQPAGSQTGSAVSRLSGGRAVVTYTDFANPSNPNIAFRTFNQDGTSGSAITPVSNGFYDTRSDVTDLANGGFAISYTRYAGGSNYDLYIQLFNSGGSPRTSGLVTVDANDMLDTDNSSVAGLTGGGLVVAYQRKTIGDPGYAVYVQRSGAIPASGTVSVLAPFRVDGGTTTATDPQVAALRDGGYALAYAEDGYGTGTDITLRLAPPGGALSQDIQVNTATAGNQTSPTLTVLTNGIVVVGWSDGATFYEQAFDPTTGAKLGAPNTVSGSTVTGELAGLAGGLVAAVWTSTIADAGGNSSIRTSINELRRTSVGDAASDTITGDDLGDLISAGGGNDVLNGGGGLNSLDGGTGYDTAVFSFAKSAATIVQTGGSKVVVGPGGVVDYLAGIERFQFLGTTANTLSPAHDHGGDGYSDIMFRDKDSGALLLAQQNGGRSAAESAYTAVQLGTDWAVISTAADFDGDGKSDILFRSVASGATIVAFQNGAQSARPSTYTDVQLGVDWTVTAADFTGDGTADLLYRQTSSGATLIAPLDGGHQTAPSAYTGAQLGTDYGVAGTGDFDGDGKADILYRKVSSGSTLIAFQDGAQQAKASAFTSVQLGNDWSVAAVADFTGDGKADILFRNVASGSTIVTPMNGAQYASPSAYTDVQLGNDYEIAGVSDFNGDGKADILFRDTFYRYTVIAFLDGAHQAAPSAYTDVQLDNSWLIV